MNTIYRRDHDMLFVSDDNILYCNLKTGTSRHIKVLPPVGLKNGKTENNCEQSHRQITTLGFSLTGLIAVSTANKWVLIYNENFEVIKSFSISRVASKISFSSSGDIVVADKTGDVYLYKIREEVLNPVFLLGHRSIILDLVLTDCGKYIITCDRDEKIRVSHFPNAYNIVSFCLGHSEFVTAIKVVKHLLISASGDGTLRFWNFLTGKQLNCINTNKFIDDTNLLQKFVMQINKEQVEVTALPISDMQVFCIGEIVYIAVSIYTYNCVQIYQLNLNDVSVKYLTKFETDNSFTYLLCEVLVIFSNSIQLFKYQDACNIEDLDLLRKCYNDYKNIITVEPDNDFISLLYKRKFDNVQEYLARKKQRLEIK